MKAPNEEIASQALERVMGCLVKSIKRFTTGNHHYVYDAFLSDSRNIVIRMTIPQEREAMRGALDWNTRLVIAGLPMPNIYHADIEYHFPFLIMERFPGRDLAYEISAMNEKDLRVLAKQLMNYQRIVGGFENCGRYGYAISSKEAKFTSWSDVISHSIERSRKRIQSSHFVNENCMKKVEELFSACQGQLEGVKSTPFLHDITTKNVIISEGKLSGIVDVDNLCYGDPLFHIALTRMALLSDGSDARYIDFLLEEHGPYSKDLFRLYTIEHCIGFISELGQPFNGNLVPATQRRKEFLEAILSAL